MNMFLFIMLKLLTLSEALDKTNLGLTVFPTGIKRNEVVINLQNNSISTVPIDAFDSLTKLRKFNMHDNILVDFPNFVPVGSTLEMLWLRNNRITNIPQHTWSSLTKLIKISINDNQLTALPNSSSLQYFTAMYACRNKITFLDSMLFYNMTSLTTIELTGNPIIGAAIFTASPTLQVLQLMDTQLKRLEVVCLEKECSLQHIEISSVELPKVDEVKSTIESFRLRNNINCVSPLSNYFQGFHALTELEFSFVSLKPFPLVSEAGNVTTLKISNNNLTDEDLRLDPGLSSMQLLKILFCTNNNLTIFPNFGISPTVIEEIHLQNNQIILVKSIFLQNMTNLRILDLSFNHITRLTDVPIQSLISLTSLFLKNNYLICDCMLSWLELLPETTSVDFLCESPRRLRFKNNSTLKLEELQCIGKYIL